MLNHKALTSVLYIKKQEAINNLFKKITNHSLRARVNIVFEKTLNELEVSGDGKVDNLLVRVPLEDASKEDYYSISDYLTALGYYVYISDQDSNMMCIFLDGIKMTQLLERCDN